MINCQTCGKQRHPVSKPGNCKECHESQLRERFRAEWTDRLKEMGYDTSSVNITKGIKSKITVTNLKCGHTFIAQMSNILNGATICGVCGPTKRMAYALKHYVDKYGRTYDLKLWKDYKLQVEILSNKYYSENKATMNPLDHPRMKANAHPNAVNLDHIIPIIYGFKNGLSPELIADGRNLRIICATQNLRKKQKLTDEARALLDSLL